MERNNGDMYNFPNDSGRPNIPVASPTIARSKVRKESGYYVDSWSSPLTREAFKRNAEEGGKREVRHR